MNVIEIFAKAFETRDIEEFLNLAFPTEWKGLAARIIESGVEFDSKLCDWAPRWSKIPPTVRNGKTEFETTVKSCMFRVHDCLHQLWGLPIPSSELNEDDFYEYKRAQMCGEVAVLTLTEFDYSNYWYKRGNDELKNLLWNRNALPLLYGPLLGKSTLQIAQRMDSLLHKKVHPRWVREMKEATEFVEDYVPMLEDDRTNINHNWKLMKRDNWLPVGAPNSRYNPNLDGLELTQWMINDFFHLMDTDSKVDEPLRDFNRNRRAGIVLPSGWNGAV